jgi:NSS family neurotransmitter:Na+ symporter
MADPERGTWAGSAIGLGNIWMFPFRTGVNGGAAFVLVYLLAVLAVGIPLMVAEVMIGRATKRNPVGAFMALRPRTAWPLVGWIGVIAGFVILSYYGVVAGWALDYTWRSATGALYADGAAGFEKGFSDLTSNGPRQVFLQAVFMAATILVVARGVEAGIEKASKVLMPSLFVLVLILLGFALSSSGAQAGLEFLLKPRFEELTSTAVLAALGQAFFSLSLGMGAMITYGSYLSTHENITKAAFSIAFMDTVLAMLAGLVIFPLVFSFGLEPGAGPGLVFITLPNAFDQLPATGFLSTAFFALLLFAALTSAISLLEVVVAFLIDQFKLPRGSASWTAGIAIFLLGVPSATFDGFLDRVDGLASNWLLPVGGLLIAVFAGWALRRDESQAAYWGEEEGRRADRGFDPWRFCIRFVAPVAVAVILLQNLGLFGS